MPSNSEALTTERFLFPALLATGAIACDEPPAPKPAASGAASATATASAAALPPMPAAAPLPKTPSPLPELKTTPETALTPEKVALGKQLFFDKRLSGDGTASCETCHLADKGWADGKVVSTKVGGKDNTRHTPSLWNVGYNDLYYWDGRSPTLEKQMEAAWKGQMGGDTEKTTAAVGAIPGYKVQFQKVFGGDATPDHVLAALGAFVRVLRSGDAPWDKYEAGDKTAVGEDAVRGFELFRNKAACAACHAPPLYTDNAFHNVGIGFDKPEPDLGRGKITKNEKENGAFKTPSLRSITTHAPYFHDGRAANIEAAVDFMLGGGIKEGNPNLDPLLKPVTLTPAERTDLLAFIKALEAPAEKFEAPSLPQ